MVWSCSSNPPLFDRNHNCILLYVSSNIVIQAFFTVLLEFWNQSTNLSPRGTRQLKWPTSMYCFHSCTSTRQRILRQNTRTTNKKNSPVVFEVFRRKCGKKSIQQKSWSWSKAALMEFCPQYCARIATEIYDKWRVLSWLLTAFDVHKVLSRKCRRTMVKYYSFWETFNESSQCLLISPKEFLFFQALSKLETHS